MKRNKTPGQVLTTGVLILAVALGILISCDNNLVEQIEQDIVGSAEESGFLSEDCRLPTMEHMTDSGL